MYQKLVKFFNYQSKMNEAVKKYFKNKIFFLKKRQVSVYHSIVF